MSTDARARARLAEAMTERRLELGMEWEQVAALGGTSVATLRRVRSGNGPLTPENTRAIERGLKWARGSVTAIVHGADPTPIDSAYDADRAPTARRDLAELSPQDQALVRATPAEISARWDAMHVADVDRAIIKSWFERVLWLKENYGAGRSPEDEQERGA